MKLALIIVAAVLLIVIVMEVWHRSRVSEWQEDFTEFYMDNYEELYKAHVELCKKVQAGDATVQCPPDWAGKSPPPPPGGYP